MSLVASCVFVRASLVHCLFLRLWMKSCWCILDVSRLCLPSYRLLFLPVLRLVKRCTAFLWAFAVSFRVRAYVKARRWHGGKSVLRLQLMWVKWMRGGKSNEIYFVWFHLIFSFHTVLIRQVYDGRWKVVQQITNGGIFTLTSITAVGFVCKMAQQSHFCSHS